MKEGGASGWSSNFVTLRRFKDEIQQRKEERKRFASWKWYMEERRESHEEKEKGPMRVKSWMESHKLKASGRRVVTESGREVSEVREIGRAHV